MDSDDDDEHNLSSFGLLRVAVSGPSLTSCHLFCTKLSIEEEKDDINQIQRCSRIFFF